MELILEDDDDEPIILEARGVCRHARACSEAHIIEAPVAVKDSVLALV